LVIIIIRARVKAIENLIQKNLIHSFFLFEYC
jgi:hypothetical protein